VRTPAGLVQIISFANRIPAVIRDGLKDAELILRDQSRLKIFPLPHLVVLKLYAGGFKSKADIVELLAGNPDAALDEIQALCSKYRIRGFAEILKELEK